MNYPSVFNFLFLQTFLLTTIFTALLYVIAQQMHLLPSIRARDVHTVRKPRIGGLAMWLAILVSFFLVGYFYGDQQLLNFNTPQYFGIDRALWGIMAGMGVILLFGLLDDLADLKPLTQLFGQFLAVLTLVIFGIGVHHIRLPFDQALVLGGPTFPLSDLLAGTGMSFWSAIFTMVWVMTMMNVMNFFDGLDGLAGSVAMVGALALVFVSLKLGFLATATLSIITVAATAGFLPWNWHPSKIFMGTVGSQLLGFLLGVIAIISGGKVATAVLVLGIPVFDAFIVVVRRLLAGQHPFQADQRHLHHRLLKIGLPTPWVVVVINAVAITFGILAVNTQDSNRKGVLTLVLGVLMLIFIILTYIFEKKQDRGRI